MANLLGNVRKQLNVDDPIVHVGKVVGLGHLLVPPQVEIEGVLQPLVLQLEGGVVLAELLVARQQLLQQPLVPVVVDCVGGQPVLQRVHVSLWHAHAHPRAPQLLRGPKGGRSLLSTSYCKDAVRVIV
jgi:hypothetical protein